MPDQPGWYPDPAQPQHARWHDGSSWTPHVRPGTPPPFGAHDGRSPADLQAAVPGWAPPQPVGPVHAVPSPGNVFTRSTLSLAAVLVALIYVLAVTRGGMIGVGLLPIGLAVWGYKLHEPLAVPALVVAALALAANIYASAGR